LRIKEQGKRLTLNEYDDDDDVSCITITDLRSLAYKFAELINFSHAPNKGTYRLKEMVLGSRDDSRK
jgi:hypothetical protein